MSDSIDLEIAALPPPPPGAAARPVEKMWDHGDGPSFADLLDIINPLQHLPIISMIYRAITGDGIGLAARLAGAALFGGPLGVALTGATAAFEEATGGQISDQLAALFRGGDAAPPAVAAAPAAAPPPRPAAASPPQRRAAATDPEPSDRAAVRARLEVQRAQARLLFARLVADGPPAGPAAGPPVSSPPRERAGPAERPAHPQIPPSDAPPEWYLQAMERAFRKYQSEHRGRGREADRDPDRRAFVPDRGTI